MSLSILPDGACTASFAGLSRACCCCLLLVVEETAEPDAEKEAVDAFEPVAMDDTMLSALEGRAKGFGERRPLMLPPSL